MGDKIYFDYMIELGCCEYCCLRFLGCTFRDYYTDISTGLKKKNLRNEEIKTEPELLTKKVKNNPCVSCLGLLQSHSINEVLETISKDREIRTYDNPYFACGVSLPIALQLRSFSIGIHLEEKFPDKFKRDSIDAVALKEAWKWIVGPKIAEKINKKLDNGATCDFLVTINMSYPNEIKELKPIIEVSPETFKCRKTEMFTRKGVENILNKIDPETFRKFIPCPPEIPDEQLKCDEVFCTHNSVYIAGRYLKFCRQLSQTPWILNGVRMMPSSVEELISEQVTALFGFLPSDIKFSSSGREDVDVRCLGEGRPFVLEILNPKITIFTNEQFRYLEEKINSSIAIRVHYLQKVPKEELVNIRQGEENKTKIYKALCDSQEPITEELLEKINNYEEITLDQMTPIRVLHRRPLACRQRKIYYMKAKPVEENPMMFTVDLQTQAGTYIKEFVHGDFGRTKPSLSSILGIEVDIVALDVTAVELDWPKKIN